MYQLEIHYNFWSEEGEKILDTWATLVKEIFVET